MELPDLQFTIPLSIIIAVSSLILTWQKIAKNAKKTREEETAKILQKAKEEDNLLKAKMEAKIEGLSKEVKNLELSVQKDISHLKESYSADLKNLGEKIETLRYELNQRHSDLIELLTKIVGKNK